MKKIALLLLGIAMFGVLVVEAQVKSVTGTVTSSDDGTGIPGVSVSVKGTTVGTVTNLDGVYRLDVPSDAQTLVFSFVGMKSQEKKIAGSTINAVMKPDLVGLDEVMVVAYGTAKKSSFTGSASTVKGEKLEKMQSSNLSKSLEGSVAGVQVVSNSGQPGDGGTILIRGLGSISASKSPLIVLDGVPYEGSLNSISSKDIESYTVLKDAAATSMYGARGSNGVVLIITKKGEKGKIKVDFDARYGVNSRCVSNYDIITDPGDYYEMIWESLRNNYSENGSSLMQAGIDASTNLIPTLAYNAYKNVPNGQLVNPITGRLNSAATEKMWTNEWEDEPFSSGARQEYSVSFSGGGEKSNYYASVNYLGDEGYVAGSNFDRVTARVKVEQDVTDFLKVGANLSYANTNQNTSMDADNLSAYNNVFMFSQNIAPIYSVYLYDHTSGDLILDGDGNKQYDFGTANARPYASEQNPVSTMQDNLNEYLIDNLSSRGFVELKFLKDFKFTANFAYDLFNGNTTDYSTPNGGDAASVGGRGYKVSTRYAALNTNQLLNYEKDLGSHHVTALFGHEIKADDSKYLLGHMTNFVDSENPEFANSTVYQDLTSYTQEYRLEGYFGRVEYDFNDKYYISSSLRYDGSSRFSEDNQWGSFWSVGTSWRLTEEDFMSGISAIDNFKIKASYGTQGNDNIGTWYASDDLYAVNRVDDQAAMSLKFRGNTDLTWEKSANFNAGIEGRFFDRFNVDAEFFIKSITDMLYASPIAGSLGTPDFIYRNEMDMKNTGFELEIGADIVETNDIKWNVSLNGMHYKNELTKLPSTKDPEGYQAGRYWRKEGASLYDWYLYEYAGVDETNGKPLFNSYDEDGNVTTVNETTDATYKKINKSALPDLTGGLSTTLDAFGFDLTIQTAFQLGGYTYDSNYANLMNGGEGGQNFHKDIYKRWTSSNTATDVPRVSFEDQEVNGASDRWLTKSSYFTLRNVQLGYNFSDKLLKKYSITSLRVYVVGDNLWLKTARKGLDSRQSYAGTVGFNYSALRTISFGVSLGL